MSDLKKYLSAPPLTLADDLSSSGYIIKTTSDTGWNDEELTSAMMSDYVPFTLINDNKTVTERGLITGSSIANLTTTGATIYKRGLKSYAEGNASDLTEYSAFMHPWTQGSTKLLLGTNPPIMYAGFPNKDNDETITGKWTFPATGSANEVVVSSAAVAPTADEALATKKYVDDTAIAGAPDATTTVKGIVEIATQAEVDAGTGTGGTSANLSVRPTELANVIQDGSYIYAADSVGTDSYAITLVPAVAAYVTGQMFNFKAGTANTGGATLNVNALGAKTILKNNDQALETGDIEAGQIVTVVYDGTNFQMQNPSAATMATALQGQLNTGYSANVTGTNLATLTAGSSSDADALHTHGELDTLIDYTSNTQLTSTYTTYTIPTYAGTGFWASNIGTVTTNSPFLWSGASTGVQTKSFAGLTSVSLAGDTILQWNNNRKIRIKTMMRMTHNSGIISFGLVTTSTELYAAQTDTNNAYARFVNNAGTWYVANTSTNAGTNTNTAISTPSDSMQLFEIVITPGVDIKYYIAEALVATHTTGLPTQAADITVGWGCSTSGQGLYHTPVVISVSNS